MKSLILLRNAKIKASELVRTGCKIAYSKNPPRRGHGHVSGDFSPCPIFRSTRPAPSTPLFLRFSIVLAALPLVAATFLYMQPAWSAEENERAALDAAAQKQLALLEAKVRAVQSGPTINPPSLVMNASSAIASPSPAATVPSRAGAASAVLPETAPASTSLAETAASASNPVSANSAPNAKVSEAEIPVLLKFDKKVENDSLGTSTRVMASFGIVIGLLAGCLFFVRRYSKSGNVKTKHNQIRVTAQHHLGPKKSVAIIRVAGESILVGITDQSISMIKQLHILDEELPEDEIAEDFRERLERRASEALPPAAAPHVSAALSGRVAPRIAAQKNSPAPVRQVFDTSQNTADDELNENDEFMMRGIRDIVSDRLRNKRNLV